LNVLYRQQLHYKAADTLAPCSDLNPSGTQVNDRDSPENEYSTTAWTTSKIGDVTSLRDHPGLTPETSNSQGVAGWANWVDKTTGVSVGSLADSTDDLAPTEFQ
jgi:hypothetical protein